MANINLTFVPNAQQSENSRLSAIENYLVRLTDRLNFCMNDIDDDVSELSKSVSAIQKSVTQLRKEITQNGNN